MLFGRNARATRLRSKQKRLTSIKQNTATRRTDHLALLLKFISVTESIKSFSKRLIRKATKKPDYEPERKSIDELDSAQ